MKAKIFQRISNGVNKKILIGLGSIFAFCLIFTIVSFAAEESLPSTSSYLEVKTSTFNLLVKDIKESQEKIINFTEEKKGEIVQSSITERADTSFASITVRVPIENFNEAITFFRGLAEKATYENTNSRDVEEEYVSLETRFKNLEEEESQLLKLMKREGTISEALEAQRELTRIKEEIERIKEESKCFEENKKMATIILNLNLSLSEKPLPEGWRQTNFLIDAIEDLFTFLKLLAYFIIEIVVWSVIWVPLLLLFLYLKKRWRKPVQPR